MGKAELETFFSICILRNRPAQTGMVRRMTPDITNKTVSSTWDFSVSRFRRSTPT